MGFGLAVLAPGFARFPHCVRQPFGPVKMARPCASFTSRQRPVGESSLPLSVPRCGLPGQSPPVLASLSVLPVENTLSNQV